MEATDGTFHLGVLRTWSEKLKTASDTQENAYLSEVASRVDDVLREYNDRDITGTNQRIDELRQTLEELFDSALDVRFGGSVARHTYVDGLSDVDVLVLINRDDADHVTPDELITDFAEQLHSSLPTNAIVDSGQLAVTITYENGEQIQLLPAVKTASGVRIANPGNGEWSQVVHPERFARDLTESNQRLAGNLVPSIKLIKPHLSDLGMSGYHMEALAIRAVKDHLGQMSKKDIVERVLRYAAENVDHRVTDPTGQEQFVDSYLGPAGSQNRANLARNISTTIAKLESANESLDADAWLETLG